jgi:hypothetical protein
MRTLLAFLRDIRPILEATAVGLAGVLLAIAGYR